MQLAIFIIKIKVLLPEKNFLYTFFSITTSDK